MFTTSSFQLGLSSTYWTLSTILATDFHGADVTKEVSSKFNETTIQKFLIYEIEVFICCRNVKCVVIFTANCKTVAATYCNRGYCYNMANVQIFIKRLRKFFLFCYHYEFCYIIWIMLLDSRQPKVIAISGGHCRIKSNQLYFLKVEHGLVGIVSVPGWEFLSTNLKLFFNTTYQKRKQWLPLKRIGSKTIFIQSKQLFWRQLHKS